MTESMMIITIAISSVESECDCDCVVCDVSCGRAVVCELSKIGLKRLYL